MIKQLEAVTDLASPVWLPELLGLSLPNWAGDLIYGRKTHTQKFDTWDD
jgi:hypothetical protein